MASSSADAASADESLVLEVEEKLRRLNLRLTDLEGKANKKERSAVNKEIERRRGDGVVVAEGAATREDGQLAAELVLAELRQVGRDRVVPPAGRRRAA